MVIGGFHRFWKCALVIGVILALVASPFFTLAAHDPVSLATAEAERHEILQAEAVDHGHSHEDGFVEEQVPGHAHGHKSGDHSHDVPAPLMHPGHPLRLAGPDRILLSDDLFRGAPRFDIDRPPRA